MNRNLPLLRRAYDAWLAADDLRTRRLRQKRYTYGDQWSDIVDDLAGNRVVERNLLIEKGRRPLTNNLIRQLVKSIVGRYRNIAAEAAIYDNTPGSLDARNHMADIDCRMLEEFVISGCAIQRIVAERRPEGEGVWVDNVCPSAFFVNSFRDSRGFDIDFVGMLHDMSLPEVVNRFGRGAHSRADALQRLYASSDEIGIFGSESLGSPTAVGVDFFRAASGRCRAIEVWQLEGRPTTVGGRLRMEMVWRCTWLAPDGTVLDVCDSPYGHASHPFAVKFYPLTDGEVHSFVEDVIDQQRTINRLVVLIDSMMATAAKGALLFPVDQLPKGVTIADVSRMWASPDAVIPITGRGNSQPTQIITNTADSGAYQLLNLQMKLFEEASGVSDALMGRNVSPATGASLYDAQVRNASVSLTDLLETFTSFTTARTAKAQSVIKN